MHTEIEIKLPISDLNRAHQLVKSFNSKIFKERHFEDNYVLDTEDLQVRNSGFLFRVRMISPADRESCMKTHAILTFKGKTIISDGLRNREEIECLLDPPESFLKAMERLGYSTKFRYQKYRTIYSVEEKQIHVCVDEAPIGNYFELEGPPEEIHEIASRLGYSREQYITDSYGGLYYRWCKEKGIDASHMVFS